MAPPKENTLLGDEAKNYLSYVSAKVGWTFIGLGVTWLSFNQLYAPSGRPEHEARLAAQQRHLDSLHTGQAASPDGIYQQSIAYSGTSFSDRLTGFEQDGFRADTVTVTYNQAIETAQRDRQALQDKIYLANKKDNNTTMVGLAVLTAIGLLATSGTRAKKIARLFSLNGVTRRELGAQIAHDEKRLRERTLARQRKQSMS